MKRRKEKFTTFLDSDWKYPKKIIIPQNELSECYVYPCGDVEKQITMLVLQNKEQEHILYSVGGVDVYHQLKAQVLCLLVWRQMELGKEVIDMRKMIDVGTPLWQAVLKAGNSI